MDSKEKTLEYIEFLIRKGTESANNKGEIVGWCTQAVQFVSNLLGEKSVYAEQFASLLAYSDNRATLLGVPILKSLKEDIQLGALNKIQALVAAEVFADFLEMSSHLLDSGYKDPAASLIGAVLENELRRIAKMNNVPTKNDATIDSLNQELTKAGVYNQIKKKQVDYWRAIRNNADHGKFDEYKIDDVKEMLRGVTQFLSEYLH